MSDPAITPFGAAHALNMVPTPPELGDLGPLVTHVSRRLKTHYATPAELAWVALEPVRWLPGLDFEDARALWALLLTSLLAQRAGSTRLPLVDAGGQAYLSEMLAVLLEGGPGAPAVAALLERMCALAASGAAAAIIGGASAHTPLLFVRPHLYIQRMHALEGRFVEALAALHARTDLAGRRERVRTICAELAARPARVDATEIRLTEEQWRAVEEAACAPVTVISGGPGTGKTTIVVTLLRILRHLGVTVEQIALAAPTGKAANRMAEAIRKNLGAFGADPLERELAERPPESVTLHRLLGYSPAGDRFKHHQRNPLSHSMVIVDESSMVDLFMMERTLRSLPPGGQLVLLGDAEQLPSVEAGAVLRDLVGESGAGPLGARSRRLVISHRQKANTPGESILDVAAAIKAGDVARLAPGAAGSRHLVPRVRLEDITFQGVEHHAPADRRALGDLLRHWYDARIRGDAAMQHARERTYHAGSAGFDPEDLPHLALLFRHLESARILCLTHAQRTGAERVNRLCHAWVTEDSGRDFALSAGEPVMMLHNDYDRGIFNGDQGVVLRVAEGDLHQRPMAVFPRAEGHGVFELDALRGALVHAFAITVHKSQGSEFDRVLLVLPETDLPLNTRELLYTAVTRARTGVLIHGTWAVFEAGARKRMRRFSGIAERLQTGCAPAG